MPFKKPAVEIGDRFRAVGQSIFSKPLLEIWQVASIAEKTDGFSYATLTREPDQRETKTLAVSALVDGKLFTRWIGNAA